MSDTMLRITAVRVVRTRPRDPLPHYEPAAGSWSTGHVEVANPVSVYPEYKPMRSLFMPDPGGVDSFWVEIATDQGVSGYGSGGPGGGPIIEGHLSKLLLGENALDRERIWDLLWRATMHYGRAGVVVNAISGVDLALWDIAGKASGGCRSTACSAAKPSRASPATAPAMTSSSTWSSASPGSSWPCPTVRSTGVRDCAATWSWSSARGRRWARTAK